MNNNDILQRFLIENASIRGEVVRLDQSYQTIMHQHPYSPAIQRLLGEALVLVTLLAAIIKFKGRLTLQFQGKGKLKLLLAQCNDDFHIRGLAQCDATIDEDELLDNLKHGILTITIDPDSNTNRYQGMIAWKGNSLTESIEEYFRLSEQLRTRIWLSVNETNASGLLLQVIPGAEGTTDLNWEHIVHLTQTITATEMRNLPIEVLLHRLYVEESVRLFEPHAVIFQCTCSARRGENAILLLGHEEIEQELSEKQIIVVTCDFCNKSFEFDRIDVENIFRQGGIPPSTTQH